MKTYRRDNVVGGVFDRIAVGVTGSQMPRTEDWAGWMRFLESERCSRILGYAGSRKALGPKEKDIAFATFRNLRQNHGRPIFSLVLQSPAPGIVSFANTIAKTKVLDVKMKVFDPSQVEPAIEYLDLPRNRLPEIREVMDTWAAELNLGRIFGLPLAFNTRI